MVKANKIRRGCTIGLLLLLSGCAGRTIYVKEEVRQPSSDDMTRGRVALQSLSIYTDRQMKHRYRQPLNYVDFRDADGTVWKVVMPSQDVQTWRLYKMKSDQQPEEVSLQSSSRSGPGKGIRPSDPLAGEAPASQPGAGCIGAGADARNP